MPQIKKLQQKNLLQFTVRVFGIVYQRELFILRFIVVIGFFRHYYGGDNVSQKSRSETEYEHRPDQTNYCRVDIQIFGDSAANTCRFSSISPAISEEGAGRCLGGSKGFLQESLHRDLPGFHDHLASGAPGCQPYPDRSSGRKPAGRSGPDGSSAVCTAGFRGLAGRFRNPVRSDRQGSRRQHTDRHAGSKRREDGFCEESVVRLSPCVCHFISGILSALYPMHRGAGGCTKRTGRAPLGPGHGIVSVQFCVDSIFSFLPGRYIMESDCTKYDERGG